MFNKEQKLKAHIHPLSSLRRNEAKYPQSKIFDNTNPIFTPSIKKERIFLSNYLTKFLDEVEREKIIFCVKELKNLSPNDKKMTTNNEVQQQIPKETYKIFMNKLEEFRNTSNGNIQVQFLMLLLIEYTN